jgi:hypothetical protein
LKRDPGLLIPENSELKKEGNQDWEPSPFDSFPILYFTKKPHHLQRKEEIFMCQLLVLNTLLKQKNRR